MCPSPDLNITQLASTLDENGMSGDESGMSGIKHTWFGRREQREDQVTAPDSLLRSCPSNDNFFEESNVMNFAPFSIAQLFPEVHGDVDPRGLMSERVSEDMKDISSALYCSRSRSCRCSSKFHWAFEGACRYWNRCASRVPGKYRGTFSERNVSGL